MDKKKAEAKDKSAFVVISIDMDYKIRGIEKEWSRPGGGGG